MKYARKALDFNPYKLIPLGNYIPHRCIDLQCLILHLNETHDITCPAHLHTTYRHYELHGFAVAHKMVSHSLLESPYLMS